MLITNGGMFSAGLLNDSVIIIGTKRISVTVYYLSEMDLFEILHLKCIVNENEKAKYKKRRKIQV